MRATEAGAGSGPRVLAAAVLAAGLLFAAWGNAAFSYSARMLIETDASWPFPVMYRGEADWGAAAEALEARLDEAEIVVTTTELKAGYFLGRQDLILSNNYLGVAPDGTPNPQYHPNHKTGLPVISLPGALEEVIACHRTGLVLVEDNHWRQSWSVDDDVADALEERTERVALDPGWRLHVFEWDHGPGFAPDTAECRAVRSRLERVSRAGRGRVTLAPAPSTPGTPRSASVRTRAPPPPR